MDAATDLSPEPCSDTGTATAPAAATAAATASLYNDWSSWAKDMTIKPLPSTYGDLSSAMSQPVTSDNDAWGRYWPTAVDTPITDSSEPVTTVESATGAGDQAPVQHAHQAAPAAAQGGLQQPSALSAVQARLQQAMQPAMQRLVAVAPAIPGHVSAWTLSAHERVCELLREHLQLVVLVTATVVLTNVWWQLCSIMRGE